MNTGEFWASLVLGVLSGGLIAQIFKTIADRIKGRSSKRSELEVAWGKADEESRRRRIAEDRFHQARKLLIEANCIDPTNIPEYPDYSD